MAKPMVKPIDKIATVIDTVTKNISRPLSLLVCLMMFFTAFEVVGRYVFNHPTSWVWPVNRQLFGIFILVAGAYTMSKNDHIRIEILYDHFPPKLKLFARIIAVVAFSIFLGALIWQSSWMGLNSLAMREKLAGAFRVPLYPFKLLIPICSLLFLLQAIVVYVRGDD